MQRNNSVMPANQRLILLPGFGEDERIFRHLIPHLERYELLVMDYRAVLPSLSTAKFNLSRFTKKLIAHYKVTKKDILIGHSLGGFIAHNIRQYVGCSICMHSSFTEPSKIKPLVHNQFLVKKTIMRGLFTSALFKGTARFLFRNTPSQQDLEYVIETLKEYGNENILKLTLLFFKRKKRLLNWLRSTPAYDLPPNLILHPMQDNILAAPDEQHIKIPGDHFSIAIFPLQTVEIIKNWLVEEGQNIVTLSNYPRREVKSYKTAI